MSRRLAFFVKISYSYWMKLSILKIFLVTLAVAGISNANAAKLYKWVDSNGNISYQDQPPPKNAKILSEKTVKSSDSDDVNTSSNLPKVLVYTVDNCDACEQMITMLNESKVSHIRLPLKDDRKAQELILQQFSSIVVPTIFINDEIIQGRSPSQVKERLKAAGFKVVQ